MIYSLSLKSVGRSTHAAGTAGAHLRYILRDGACRTILARGIPADGMEAAAWMDAQEAGDRSNARVCDKVLLALPHELPHERQNDLLRAWADDVSGGVPYIVAIHHPSRDGDQRNDHGHVVFRDRDPATGKRVMRSTDKTFTDRMRLSWETHVNAAMAAAGLDGRTDRRSNAERGIDRIPQTHVGPAATAAARRAARGGVTPAGRPSAAQPLRSKARTVRNGVGARSPSRVVDYEAIDEARTRSEENERRIAANVARDRADARAEMEARLATARASMTALGLGITPGLQSDDLASPPLFAQSSSRLARSRAMAAALAADPMTRPAVEAAREVNPSPPQPLSSLDAMVEEMDRRAREDREQRARDKETRLARMEADDAARRTAQRAEAAPRQTHPPTAPERLTGGAARTAATQQLLKASPPTPAPAHAQDAPTPAVPRQTSSAPASAPLHRTITGRPEPGREGRAHGPIGAEAARAMLRDGDVIAVDGSGRATLVAREDLWNGAARNRGEGLHGLGRDSTRIGLTWTADADRPGGWMTLRASIADIAKAIGGLVAAEARLWIARLARATAESIENERMRDIAATLDRRVTGVKPSPPPPPSPENRDPWNRPPTARRRPSAAAEMAAKIFDENRRRAASMTRPDAAPAKKTQEQTAAAPPQTPRPERRDVQAEGAAVTVDSRGGARINEPITTEETPPPPDGQAPEEKGAAKARPRPRGRGKGIEI